MQPNRKVQQLKSSFGFRAMEGLGQQPLRVAIHQPLSVITQTL